MNETELALIHAHRVSTLRLRAIGDSPRGRLAFRVLDELQQVGACGVDGPAKAPPARLSPAMRDSWWRVIAEHELKSHQLSASLRCFWLAVLYTPNPARGAARKKEQK